MAKSATRNVNVKQGKVTTTIRNGKKLIKAPLSTKNPAKGAMR